MNLQEIARGFVNLESLLKKHDPTSSLKSLNDRFSKLEQNLENAMATMQDLISQIQKNSSVIDSVVVLLNQVAQRIEDAGNDPKQLDQLVDELRTKDDQLAAAVAQNTALNPTTSTTQPPTADPNTTATTGTTPAPDTSTTLPGDVGTTNTTDTTQTTNTTLPGPAAGGPVVSP